MKKPNSGTASIPDHIDLSDSDHNLIPDHIDLSDPSQVIPDHIDLSDSDDHPSQVIPDHIDISDDDNNPSHMIPDHINISDSDDIAEAIAASPDDIIYVADSDDISREAVPDEGQSITDPDNIMAYDSDLQDEKDSQITNKDFSDSMDVDIIMPRRDPDTGIFSLASFAHLPDNLLS